MKHSKKEKMTTTALQSRTRLTVGPETTVFGLTLDLAMNIKYD